MSDLAYTGPLTEVKTNDDLITFYTEDERLIFVRGSAVPHAGSLQFFRDSYLNEDNTKNVYFLQCYPFAKHLVEEGGWRCFRSDWNEGHVPFEFPAHTVSIQDLRSWSAGTNVEKGAALLAGVMHLLDSRDAVIYWEQWRSRLDGADIVEWLEDYFYFLYSPSADDLTERIPFAKYYGPGNHMGEPASWNYFRVYLKQHMRHILQTSSELDNTMRVTLNQFVHLQTLPDIETYVLEGIKVVQLYYYFLDQRRSVTWWQIPKPAGRVASALGLLSTYKSQAENL